MFLTLVVLLCGDATRAEDPMSPMPAVPAPPAVPVPAAPAVDATPTSLEGTWVLVSAEFLGEKMPADETEGKRIVFRGNQMYMLDKGEEIGADTDKATFKLDEASNPKGITMTDPDEANQSWNGIFMVENGQLTLVMAPPGGERPKAFDAANTMKMVLKKS
jgi:uncharacterized protein (TIGR03067 family)